MLRLLLKIFIIISTLALLVISALLITAWWLGAFTPVQILATERGPYFIITLLEPNTPNHLPAQINQIRSYLDQRGTSPLQSLGVFYQDPSLLSRNTIEAGGGWLIKDSTAVDSPYIMLNINKQMVASAVIKINRLIAPYKTYPILKAWIERNGYQPTPNQLILELYRTADSLEIQIPISKIQYDSISNH